MKKIIIVGMLFLLGIASCNFPNKKEAKPFTIAVSSLPETLDPIMRSEIFTNIATMNIFENLFYWENGVLKPQLATEWYYKNPEKTILEIKLRKNVFFHNMTLMNSKDVVSSIMRAMTKKKSIYYSKKLNSIDSLKIISDYKLDIFLSKYNKLILSTIANIPIYNSEMINQMDDEQIAKTPIGTGHFMYDSSDPSSLTLKAFPNYWGKKQTLRKVILTKVSSKKAQLEHLLNGKVDFIISPEIGNIKKIIFSKNADLVSIPNNKIMYMMLNGNKYINGSKKNPLHNILVRKAIFKSLDLDSFISQKLYKKAKRINIPFLPSLLGNDPKYKLSEYLPAESIQLLKKAGYPDGFDMDILCIKNKYMGDSLSGDFVKTSLKKIGINAKMKFFNSKEFYERINHKEGMAFITGYSYAGTNMPYLIKFLYSTIPNNSHLNRYNNEIPGFNRKAKMFDTIIEKSDKWFELLSECLDMSYNSKYVIPLYYPNGLLGINSKYQFNKKNEYLFYFDNISEKK